MRIVPLALIAVLILAAQPAAAAGGPKWADPESPLYGLKIALENANEAFSFNKEARLQKQLDHAEERLAEAQAMGDQNRTRAMERAIERYEAKLGQINDTVCEGDIDKQGVEHAMNMTAKHRVVLQGLIDREDMPYQARLSLQRALNNSEKSQLALQHAAQRGSPKWAQVDSEKVTKHRGPPEWAGEEDETDENTNNDTANVTAINASIANGLKKENGTRPGGGVLYPPR